MRRTPALTAAAYRPYLVVQLNFPLLLVPKRFSFFRLGDRDVGCGVAGGTGHSITRRLDRPDGRRGSKRLWLRPGDGPAMGCSRLCHSAHARPVCRKRARLSGHVWRRRKARLRAASHGAEPHKEDQPSRRGTAHQGPPLAKAHSLGLRGPPLRSTMGTQGWARRWPTNQSALYAA
jgi:hypothetical protein